MKLDPVEYHRSQRRFGTKQPEAVNHRDKEGRGNHDKFYFRPRVLAQTKNISNPFTE